MHGKVISENRCSDVHLKFLGAALLKSTFTVLNFCQLLFESIKHAQLLQKYSILVEYGNWLLAYTQCMWISTCAKLIIITDFQWELYRFGKDNSTNNFTLIKQVFHFPNWKDVESFTSIYQLLGKPSSLNWCFFIWAEETHRSKSFLVVWRTQWETFGKPLPWSGGVIVIICAVNSSSKYLVSVSDVTCGLNGGTSYEKQKKKKVSIYRFLQCCLKQVEFDIVIGYRAFSCLPKMSKKHQYTKKEAYIVKYTYLGVHSLFIGHLRHLFP